MRRTAPVLVLIAGFALGACGGSGSSNSVSMASRSLRMVEATKILHKPYEIKAPPRGPAPEDVVVKEIHRGYGPAVGEGEKVKLMYLDADYADKSGRFFYSAWNTLKFLEFTIGAREASPAWEKAVEGMRLGGRREVVMPASMSDGSEKKASPVIPPDAEDVVFIADLYYRG